MDRRRTYPVVLLIGTWGISRAQAQERPDEQSLFGGPPAASAPAETTAPTATENPPAATPAATPPPAAGTDRDRALLAGRDTALALGDRAAPDNPLTIGGQLYLRTQTSLPYKEEPHNWALAAPSLIDAFFDARPNDRVRAFILGRVGFDPTAPPNGTAALVNPTTGFSPVAPSRGPSPLLDQMWIRFDVEHRVFVTAGKQHVKWGTGHTWTPTDYLHPTKRNPLDVFDVRGGVSMLRVQVPSESQSANVYAYAVFEDPNRPSNRVENVAGAARIELLLLQAEVGLGVFAKSGQRTRVAADLSTGLGDFDLYADAGVHLANDYYGVAPGAMLDPTRPLPAPVPIPGVKTQLVAGTSWSRKYNDNDMFTIGAEYFYNQLGYADRAVYPLVIAESLAHPELPMATFFYLGRHYLAVSLSLPAPYSWNYTTFTLSTLGNLSDRSYITRLDYSTTVLTHLTVEAFVAGHYGQEGGELRFHFVAAGIPTPFIDAGAALRLKF